MFSVENFEKCYNEMRILKGEFKEEYDKDVIASLKRLNDGSAYSSTTKYLGHLGFSRIWLNEQERLEVSNEFEGLDPKTIHLGHNDYIFFKYKNLWRLDEDNSFDFKKYVSQDNFRLHNYFPNYGATEITTKEFNLGASCPMPCKLNKGLFPKSCSCDDYDYLGYKNKLLDEEGQEHYAIKVYSNTCDCCRKETKCGDYELWGGFLFNTDNRYSPFDFNSGNNYRRASKICKNCRINKTIEDIEDQIENCKDNRLNSWCSVENCGKHQNRIKKLKTLVGEGSELDSHYEDFNYQFCSGYDGDFINTIEAIVEITNQNDIGEFKDLINNDFNDTNNLIIKKFLENDTLKELLTIEHFKKDGCNDFMVYMTDILFEDWFLCCDNCIDNGYKDCEDQDLHEFNDFSSCDYCQDRFLTGDRVMYDWNGGDRYICECCIDNEGETELERVFQTAQYGDCLKCEECEEFVCSIGTYNTGEDDDEEEAPFYDFAYNFQNKDTEDYRSRTKLFKIYCSGCKEIDNSRIDIIPTLKELEENIQIVKCGICGADNLNREGFCINCNDNLYFKYREGKLNKGFKDMMNCRLTPLLKYHKAIEPIGVDSCYVCMEDEDELFKVKKNCSHGLTYKCLLDMSKFSIYKDDEIKFNCGMCRHKIQLHINYL